jgi:hypothetical protein
VEGHARSIRSQGADISTTADNVNTEWKNLGPHFESPDTATLLAVLTPTTTEGEDVERDAGVVARALEAYAQTERTLAQQKATLLADIGSFEQEIASDDEWLKDENKVKKQNELLSRINGLVAAHNEAERTCANAINAIYGGTQYRETQPGDAQPAAGEEYYGYSRDALNSASGAGQTPWGKPAEWDKPWWQDAWDGVVDFGSGVWESFKGTAEGLVALVNPFDWDTFSTTWKGIGTLAVDVAITSSPVMAFVAPDKYKESAGRLKTVGEAMIHLDEWKTNPAKAAGMLTGDIIQTVATGGVGAAGKGLSVAGKAGKLVGKAGKVAADAHLVSASTALKFSDTAIRGINKTAFAFENVNQSLRSARYAVTDAAMERVLPQYYKAAEATRGLREFGVQTMDQARSGVRAGTQRWSPENVGAMTTPNGSLVRGPRQNFDELYQSNLRDIRQQRAMSGPDVGGATGHGSGSAGAKGSGDNVVEIRRRTKWPALGQSEFDKKLGGIQEEHAARASMTPPEKTTFVDPKDIQRSLTRKTVMRDFSGSVEYAGDATARKQVLARMEVPESVQTKIESDIQAHAASKVGGQLDPTEYEVILRENLHKFDMDHRMDLQLGGEDRPENTQWLHRSVNRSVGSQLMHQRVKGEFEFSKPQKFITGTPIDAFVEGTPR